ncbi:hypothetical protein [Sunxiuqinia dokdonensis]|uniref:Sensor of ECF-type sigma factor n=1 Tax=Sunxiuqinia dokdonensis TaxID=1409788 RepID=A0A0L8V2U0_9BACT|nr:hypothetical protein [Sunxiuqinia dokdonensis]KOH42820.1 hypothetical protein NC99_43770 [Sunxiuqinia dokdonensis]
MKRLILFFLTIATASGFLMAQPNKKHSEDWIQKIKAEKVAFLTQKLELTPGEAQKFWPVYNEFEEKRFEIHMKRREMEWETMDKLEGLNQEQLKKITVDFIGLFQKEADLMKDYNEKFFEVLPAKKVVMLYDMENDFRSHMLREYKDKQKDDKR